MNWKAIAALGLLSTTLACGGDARPGSGSSTDDRNNGMSNGEGSNNGTVDHGAPNNGTGNNGTGNNGGTGSNNGGETVPRPVFDGNVGFLAPLDPVTFTNDTVSFEMMAEGDAVLDALLANGEEVGALDGPTFDWDTTSSAEGEYDVRIQYLLDGEENTSEVFRTVMVDRTAPEILSATPAAGEDAVLPGTPIRLRLSEAVDIDTVNESSVLLSLNGLRSTQYAVTPADDGESIDIEIAGGEAKPPYYVSLQFEGVADFAGNLLQDNYAFRVRAWVKEPLPLQLSDMEYLVFQGDEFIAGTVQSRIADKIVLLKYDPAAQSWETVAQQTREDVHDIDATVSSAGIHVAALRTDGAMNSIEVFDIDPAAKTMDSIGVQATGAAYDGGRVALDVQGTTGKGLIAAIQDSRLMVFDYTGDIPFSIASIFPSDAPEYNNAREDGDLALTVLRNGSYEVAFSRCAAGISPCFQSQLVRSRRSSGAWSLQGTFNTPVNFTNPGSCDKFQSVDIDYLGSSPVAIMTYRPNCDEAARAHGLRASTSTWDAYLPDAMLADMPAASDTGIAVKLSPIGADEAHILATMPQRLLVAKVSGDTTTWYPELITDFTLDQTHTFRSTDIGTAPDGEPVVLLRYDGISQVWRTN